MRWAQVRRGGTAYGYGPDAITLLATPLYSNTTLVVFLPTMAWGGTAVLMAKFNALEYLRLAERHRITHTMLVPVQYQRLMALPEFGSFDLSSFRMKFCTSAPFAAALKADVLARWPGGLVEFYGMTEGGGSCALPAHLHPDKLHTVGQPMEGHDIRLIDDEGREVGPGETGEVVGRSGSMMLGYHGQPAKTREAEWTSPAGERFIRTGDVGRFDDDGFLTLLDRKKDMVISGGFNIYPSDLEAVLREHPAVADVAVVGVPSEQWGETPVGFVVRREGQGESEAELLQWFNQRIGKTQRLAALHFIDELPRSAIGKVLKRELRELHRAAPAAALGKHGNPSNWAGNRPLLPRPRRCRRAAIETQTPASFRLHVACTMPVIAIVNRKGGSGKSTLATHLAACFANSGVAVMLGDVDRQQSTQSWLRLRSEQALPASAPIVGWAVDPKRVLRPPAGVSLVILDTPGGLHGFDLARVAAFADVILMPVCNSAFDRESAAACHAELMALPRVASGRCKLAAVGMRLDARTRAAETPRGLGRGD